MTKLKITTKHSEEDRYPIRINHNSQSYMKIKQVLSDDKQERLTSLMSKYDNSELENKDSFELVRLLIEKTEILEERIKAGLRKDYI